MERADDSHASLHFLEVPANPEVRLSPVEAEQSMFKTLFAGGPVPLHPGCACMNVHESHTGVPATPKPGGPCGPWSPVSPLEPCSFVHQFIISIILYFRQVNSKYLFFNKSSKCNGTLVPSGPTGPVDPAAPGGP